VRERGVTANLFKIGSVSFPISEATFRYHAISDLGRPGWDFQVRAGESPLLTSRSHLFGKKPRFYAEKDPIPLEDLKDLTGTEIHLKEPFDPETGEPYFTLYVFEHGDLTNLKLKFMEKKGSQYLVQIAATVPDGSVFSTPKRLRIETWMKRLPTIRSASKGSA
jgi:hypothetical protein